MDQSPFGKLSAEIRNSIYHLVLLQDKPLVLTLEKDHYKPRMPKELRVRHLAPLTSACKQIRDESMPVFIGNSHFKIVPDIELWDFGREGEAKVCSSAILGWMDRLGGCKAHVRFLEVEIEGRVWEIEGLCSSPPFATDVQHFRNSFRLPGLKFTVALTGQETKKFGMTLRISGDDFEQILKETEVELKETTAAAKRHFRRDRFKAQRVVDHFNEMQQGVVELVKGLQDGAGEEVSGSVAS